MNKIQKNINIVGASYFKQWDGNGCFAVQYNDGITITYTHTNDTLVLMCMLSVGLSSSYLRTGRWPSTASINTRSVLANNWFTTNKKRYKLLKK